MAGPLVGQFLSAASALAFEIILTRVFSLSQWYHFAFIAVSLALLGYGASGALLSISQRLARIHPSWLAIGQSIGTVAGYLLANIIPFDAYRIAWEPIHVLYLAAYLASLAIPFLFAGLLAARLLSSSHLPVTLVYASNLIGSALGGALSLVLTPWLPGASGITACAAIASLSALALAGASLISRPFRYLIPMGALTLAWAFFTWTPPVSWEVPLSPYKALSQTLLRPNATILLRQGNSYSQITLVKAPGIRSLPGLSLTFAHALPEQLGIFIDGDDLSGVIVPRDPRSLEALQYTPEAVLHLLRPKARILIMEPASGQAIWLAHANGASEIVASVRNTLIVDALHRALDEADNPYAIPTVRTIQGGIRAAAIAEKSDFDVIQLPLTDSFRPLRSGAFSLSEDYRLTVEAVQEYLTALDKNGILAITRWAQIPPAESLRAGALLVEALNASHPANHVTVIRSWSTYLLMAKKEPFTPEEIATILRFCHERQFDLVAYPGMHPEEANRYSQLNSSPDYEAFQTMLTTPDRQSFYRAYSFDIHPPTDDRPFFHHYFTWMQTPAIIQTLGTIWEPFGGSGYLVLILLLAITAVLATACIILPVLFAHRLHPLVGETTSFRFPRLRILTTFASLGFAFMAVEMPLLHQFILLMDQPTYAFALVLASLLIFAGFGSSISSRLPGKIGFWLAPLVALVTAIALSPAIHIMLRQPMWQRVAVGLIILAPLGIAMGMPFPRALALLQYRERQLIPWAWAINGACSVIGSVLAMIFALTWGFRLVLIVGAVTYAGAAWSAGRLASTSGRIDESQAQKDRRSP